MKKHSFRGKILGALLILSTLLTITICVTVGWYYKHKEMQRYSELAYSYARTAAEYIDGNKIEEYIKTEKKDAYYIEVMDFLNVTQAQTDILYYYVFVPYEDDLVYVWDADNIEGACELGYHESYMEGGKEDSFQAMEGRVKENIKITDDETYGDIGSAYYPIYNDSGESVALVGVDLSMPDINLNLLYFIMVIIVCVILVVLLFISILFVVFNKAFIRPVNSLNTAAKNMVSNLESDVDMEIQYISTGDEIQELAESFGRMYIEVKDYIQRLETITTEKERIGAELNVAKKIQKDMLPCIFPAFPERHEFDIYATMTPAKEVGGDFYDFFLVDENHLALVIADVSGKGIPAALFMMISKILIKGEAQSGLSPKEVLERVNNQLCENNEAEMFVTVWLGILEISSGKMVCANAGHEYPAIKRKDGRFELHKDRHGFVLAGMENSRYREYELFLEPGDTVFVYTDGVTEASNTKNELFGTERMIEALEKKNSKNCKEILETVRQDVDCFVGEAPQFDDITMLCLQILDIRRLVIRPTDESMEEVMNFIEAEMKKAGAAEKKIRKLLTAADEVYSNIVYYSGAERAAIECSVEGESLVLVFRDNGKLYNPLESEEPDVTIPAEERKFGGLGIYIVKKIMDEVKYEEVNGCNVLSLKI